MSQGVIPVRQISKYSFNNYEKTRKLYAITFNIYTHTHEAHFLLTTLSPPLFTPTPAEVFDGRWQ